ncbi:hypothetical protein HQ524_00500 [Candidatus Uhrbacteria bacterium]|nr:hypothetical protein [Candidatus Uhrbacteria bacterium]
MEQSSSNFLSQGLKLVSNCPLCKKPHSTDPHIIEASDEMCLVHVTCGHCKHAILAVMNMQDVGVSCTGIMTDLSKEDTDLLLDGNEVDIDDVLMTHEALSTEGFLSHFRQKA